MRVVVTTLMAALAVGACTGAEEREAAAADSAETLPGRELPMVVLSTSLGDITVELYPEEAPTTVANVLEYVDAGFYDETVFHRVIPGFMVQGGGFDPDMNQKPTRPAIKNEADNGLKNARGTLAMARLPNPHTATAQFFINLVDNGFLDHAPPQNFGYAVFGRVVEGMDVVDAIATVPTTMRGRMEDVPAEPVIIHTVRRK